MVTTCPVHQKLMAICNYQETPYDLLIRYTPQVHQPTQKTTIPSLEQRLSSIEEARKAAQEAQHKAQESWIVLLGLKPMFLRNLRYKIK